MYSVFDGGLSIQEYEPVVPMSPSGGLQTSDLRTEFVRGEGMGGGVGGMVYSIKRDLTPNTQNLTPTIICSHANHRGDVIARSDETGSLTSFALYEAYGTRPYEWEAAGTLGDPDRQKANTKEEETDLNLLNEGMRYRDLETGVFLSRDPIGYGDGPNMYCYVHCNPITKFDPLGLSPYIPGVMQGAPMIDLTNAENRAVHVQQVSNIAEGGAVIAAVCLTGGLGPAAVEVTKEGVSRVMDKVLPGSGIIVDADLKKVSKLPENIKNFSKNAGNAKQGFKNVVDKVKNLFKKDGKEAAANLNKQGGTSPSVGQSASENKAYRYMSEGEAKVAEKNGKVPNTDAKGNPKDVHYSPDKYDSVSGSESSLQIGKENPHGATASPTHRAEVDASDANWKSAGNVDGGDGVEMVTDRELPVIKIDELETD
jgi:RHS repeat-associated protein